jgi:DNA-binding MarR family transcriptional regulator/GNAT superfamily N-acetyltransferase
MARPMRKKHKAVAKTVTPRATRDDDATMREVAGIRKFNRFYTQQIGVLNRDFLETPFSLAEGRVLYELYYRERTTATAIGQELGLDAGYLSRILRGFERKGLLEKEPSTTDARQTYLHLSKVGRRSFEEIEARQRVAVVEMLTRLPDSDRPQLIGAMHKIERLLGLSAGPAVPYILRPHQPGDIGWVTHRQGVLYNEEYGWDETCEAFLAGILSQFILRFNPKRERSWIAERDGEIVGSVFCAEKTKSVAVLRLLYVEPSVRGLGIGTRLVGECARFAKRAGYKKLTLWTNSVLHSARRIYERASFRLVESKAHHSFGHDLVGQTWELSL